MQHKDHLLFKLQGIVVSMGVTVAALARAITPLWGKRASAYYYWRLPHTSEFMIIAMDVIM